MKKAYIYPITDKNKVIDNPYIHNFIKALSPRITFLNNQKPSAYGIFDLLLYINKIDFLFLNWIEDLPDKRGGLLQTFFLLPILSMVKLKKIKIFYTIHNRESHITRYATIKKKLRRTLYYFADFLLTHSSAGIELLPKQKYKNKTLYIPHPFQDVQDREAVNDDKLYDILLWGTILRYKGIDKFLSFCQTDERLSRLKILVAGRIQPKDYEPCFSQFGGNNIQIINSYIDDDILNTYIKSSRIIIFTYLKDSILSSGALVYSLDRRALIIGPNTGAFSDMHKEGLLEVYDNYQVIYDKMMLLIDQKEKYLKRIDMFVTHNSWTLFGEKIFAWLGIE